MQNFYSFKKRIMKFFENKPAIVTEADSGFGKSTSLIGASRSACEAISDIRETNGDERKFQILFVYFIKILLKIFMKFFTLIIWLLFIIILLCPIIGIAFVIYKFLLPIH